jgi:hypothetical protein
MKRVAALVTALTACLAIAPAARAGVTWAAGMNDAMTKDAIYFVDTDAGRCTKMFETPGITGDWYGACDGDDDSSIFGLSWSYWDTESCLYRIGVYGHTVTQIGSPLSAAVKEIAYDPDANLLYGTTYTDLYSIHPATGIATHVGSHGGGIDYMTALHYERSSGRLLGVATPGFGDTPQDLTTNLYRIDTGSGAATLIGQATADTNLTDTWYDRPTGGTFAVCTAASRNYYAVNTTNGAATAVGSQDTLDRLLGTGNPDTVRALLPAGFISNWSHTQASASASVEDFRDEMGGDWDQSDDEQYGGSSTAAGTSAHATYTYDGTGETVWESVAANAQTSATDGPGMVSVKVEANGSATGHADNPIEQMRYGEPWTRGHCKGTVQIGTNDQNPAGSEVDVYVALDTLTKTGFSPGLDLQLWVRDPADPYNYLLYETADGHWLVPGVQAGDELLLELRVTAAKDYWSDEEPDGAFQAVVEARLWTFGQPVPEPATVVLLAFGSLGLAARRRRRR